MLIQRTHSKANLQHRGEKPLWIMLSLCVVLSVSGCASKPMAFSQKRIIVPPYYTVKSGDTLSNIGERYGMSFLEIARLNGINEPYRIYVNQSLKLKDDGTRPSQVNVQALAAEAPIVRQTVTVTPTTTTPTNTQVQKPTVTSNKTTASQNAVTHYANISWQRPTAGAVIQRFDAKNNVKGIRFGGSAGTPVVAAAAGDVLYANDGLKEYGNLVLIGHINGYITAYAHNSKLLVKSGDKVTAGQQIALMGSTGTSQVMLEFQIRSNGKPIDPSSILPNL